MPEQQANPFATQEQTMDPNQYSAQTPMPPEVSSSQVAPSEAPPMPAVTPQQATYEPAGQQEAATDSYTPQNNEEIIPR